MADLEQLKVFSGGTFNPDVTYRDANNVALTIAGIAFEGFFLDKVGGSKLLPNPIPITNLEDDSADGRTGVFQPLVTATETAALQTANTIPTVLEIWATQGSYPYKWAEVPILFKKRGT